MLELAGALGIGVAIGVRHAFEPDHLTAVATLVAEVSGARRGAWLGMLWGIGHTVALVGVAVVLAAIGTALPDRVALAFEGVVAVMLVALGIRAIIGALRTSGPVAVHRHGATTHTHAAAPAHVHAAGRAIALRPLFVGLVHGLAGSGALTALAFAKLPGPASQLVYIGLFGVGSIAGMALISALAGASLPLRERGRRAVALVAGSGSVILGVIWAGPLIWS